MTPFTLDDIDNPHPAMLHAALRIRARARNRPWDSIDVAEWRGYLKGMCDATGCTSDDINDWLDRHAKR